jgi:hypothetical protein
LTGRDRADANGAPTQHAGRGREPRDIAAERNHGANASLNRIERFQGEPGGPLASWTGETSDALERPSDARLLVTFDQ